MLSRSLFKPVFTNYWSKAVTFTATLNKDNFGDTLAVSGNTSKVKPLLKKPRIKSFFTFSKNFSPNNCVVPSQGSFGLFFSKASTSKLIMQVASTEVPLAIFFNNFASIPVSLCGKRIVVYNGKLLMPIYVKRSLLGVSFRHLIRCKKLGRTIHTSSTSGGKIKKKN